MNMKVAILTIWLVVTASTEKILETESPWLWAIFGVVMYNYLVFTLTKDELDDSNKKINFKAYFKEKWDNWVWALFCVPVIVIYGDQLWYYVMAYYEKDWQFYNVIYLGAGVLAEGLYYLLKKFRLLKKRLNGDK